MRPVSHIIKLAENAPVNHTGLYAGNGNFFHATNPPRGQSAVTGVPLGDRLQSGTHRTVTALRHHLVSCGELNPQSVVDEAAKMAAEGARYGLVELISLVIPTFWRSYHQYFERTGPARETVGRLLKYVSENLLADIEAAATDPTSQAETFEEDPLSVTCSEMVYLSYHRARAGCVNIVNPLARWGEDTDRRSPVGASPRSARSSGSRVLLTFHPPIPVQSEAIQARSGSLIPTGQEIFALMERAIRVVTDQVDKNLVGGKYSPNHPAALSPLSDCVTPGDIWSSPSFDACVVYHLPPTNPRPRFARPQEL
jgi:hypothetical protein